MNDTLAPDRPLPFTFPSWDRLSRGYYLAGVEIKLPLPVASPSKKAMRDMRGLTTLEALGFEGRFSVLHQPRELDSWLMYELFDRWRDKGGRRGRKNQAPRDHSQIVHSGPVYELLGYDYLDGVCTVGICPSCTEAYRAERAAHD